MDFFKHPSAIVESKNIGENTKIWHFVHIRKNAKIGKNCNIGKSSYIDVDVVIGNNVKIQNFVSVYKGVIIEDDVFVGPSVTFTNDKYPRSFLWDDSRLCETIVKKGASIGANSTIVCGITIGDYAMVGAGSVVTKSVPPHTLVVGNPSKPVGFICFCGKKLSKIKKKTDEKIVFECSTCKKEVVVSYDLYSKTFNRK